MITRKQYNELKEKVENLERLINGGKGSGNFGHAGRPGEVGGSAPSGSGGVGGGKGDSDAARYIHDDPRGKYVDGFDTLDTAKEYIVDKAGDSFSGGLGEQIAMAYEDDARDFLDLPSRDEESDGAEMSMSDYADLQDRMQEVIREKSWDDLETDLDIRGVQTALDYGLDKGGYEFASKNAELGQAGLSHDDAVRDLKSFMADFGITDHYGAIKAAEGGDLRTAWQNISYDMRDRLKDEYDYDPMSRNAFKGATTNNFVPRPDELYKNGGKGSGNFGHSGRPGEIGGSAPSGLSGNLGSRSTDEKIESYQEQALDNLGFTDVEKMTDEDWENVRTEMTRLIAEKKGKDDIEKHKQNEKEYLESAKEYRLEGYESDAAQMEMLAKAEHDKVVESVKSKLDEISQAESQAWDKLQGVGKKPSTPTTDEYDRQGGQTLRAASERGYHDDKKASLKAEYDKLNKQKKKLESELSESELHDYYQEEAMGKRPYQKKK